MDQKVPLKEYKDLLCSDVLQTINSNDEIKKELKEPEFNLEVVQHNLKISMNQNVILNKCKSLQECSDVLQTPSSNDEIKNELEDSEFNLEGVHHSFDIKEDVSTLEYQLEEEIPSESGFTKETFACDVCDYKCFLNSDLADHMKTHTGEKPFSCDICNFKCVTKYALMSHTRTHTGEKPFACEFCDYKYTRKQALQHHIMRTHTGEKPFECYICFYKCSEKRALKYHIGNHSKEKRFACDVCDYKSSVKWNLKQHKIIHTGGKPFQCNICQLKSYVNKDSLKKHIMKIHSRNKPSGLVTLGLVNHDLKERMRTAIKQLFVSHKLEK